MKICILTTDYLPNIGGVAAHVYHLSRALTRLGHQVAVVNPVARDDTQIESSREDGFLVCRVGVNQNDWAYRNKMIRKLLISRAALRGVEQVREMLGGIDIVHQQDYQDTTYAAARLSNSCPWIWTNHTSRFMRDGKRPLKMKFIALSYGRVSGIIAVSPEREQGARAVFPTKSIVCIPNGVDTESFTDALPSVRSAHGLSDQDLVVLCPSRMTEKKGVLYLAEAIGQILKAAPDYSWKFLFVGSTDAVNTDTDYISRIKQTLAPFERTGAVRYLGNVPLKEMPQIYRLADIVMMPSLTEGMSLSALEGMATGCAMVVTRVGGLPEVIHHERTGLLVPSMNTGAITEALVRLARDAELRRELGHNAQQLVREQYSWTGIARSTLDFYASVIQDWGAAH